VINLDSTSSDHSRKILVSTSVLDAARRYIAAGLSVIPIGREKRPAFDVLPKRYDPEKRKDVATWDPYQTRQATDAELVAWFGGQAQCGIAIIGGAVSGGLEILDFDEPDLFPLWREMLDEHQPGLFERLMLIETPRGGYQIPYRCEVIQGSKKLARRRVNNKKGMELQTLIETKGEGGYVVTSPSPGVCHPSGRQYRIVAGDWCHLLTVTPDERLILHGLAAALSEYHEPEHTYPTTEKVSDQVQGVRPGDHFNTHATWAEILEPQGWTYKGKSRGIEKWARPGESSHRHHANVLSDKYLYVFTTATQLEPGKCYDRFSLYTFLNHDGDFKASSRALRAQGYGALIEDDGQEPQVPAKMASLPALACAVDNNIPGGENIAAKLNDIISLITTEWGWSDELKVTLFALHGIAGGRQSFRASKRKIAMRIRKLKGDELEGKESDDQFGRRRVQEFRKALKDVKYPILTILERGGEWRRTSKGKRYRTEAKFKFDITPFLEALQLAQRYLDNWQAERQRFDEWRELKTPNPDKARRRAAAEVAKKYGQTVSEPSGQSKKRMPKDPITREQDARDALMKQCQKLADAWEDMQLSDAERDAFAQALVAKVRQTLHSKSTRKRIRQKGLAGKWPVTDDTPFSESQEKAKNDGAEIARRPLEEANSIAYAQSG
jgi:uncharacterized membrane protein